MRITARQRLSVSAVALAVVLALHGVASAQGTGQDPGIITGEVARCVNGAEQPASQVAIGVDGGGGTLARTDSNGQFFLALPPGQYNVVATASDGTASRPYVPVDSGQTLDIGTLDIGGSIAGCGPDSDITAPVLPTLTSTSTPMPATPIPAATATVQPSATPPPTPATDATPDPSNDADSGA